MNDKKLDKKWRGARLGRRWPEFMLTEHIAIGRRAHAQLTTYTFEALGIFLPANLTY